MDVEIRRNVRERLVVIARHDEDVAVVHRLDIHERGRPRVFVADRYLGGTVYQIAEGAVRRVAHDHGCLRIFLPSTAQNGCHGAAAALTLAPDSPKTPPELIFRAWPLRRKPSANPPPASPGNSWSVPTAPCFCRAGSTIAS